MSIQDTINRNVNTKEGRFRHSFVIIGESGSADIPVDVNIRFYNCSISTLTCNGNNIVFTDGGTISSVVAKTSSIMSRGTTISGTVDATSTSLDLSGCTITGSVQLKTKSFVRADSCTFSGSSIAIDAREGSNGRVTRSTFAGHGTSAVKSDSASYVLLSKCDSVKAAKSTLWAKDRGIIEAIQCTIIEGTGTQAVETEDFGRVELLNCTTVKGAVHVLNGKTNGYAIFNKCTTIKSDADAALFLDSRAGVEVRSFDVLKSTGNSAIKMLSSNSAYIFQGNSFQSDAKDAVEINDNSYIEISGVITVKGTGRNAVTAVKNCDIRISNVTTLEGTANRSIDADQSCTIQITDGKDVNGVGDDAINIRNQSIITVTGVKNVTGQLNGINSDTSSRVTVHRVDTLKGTSSHGILAKNSKIVVQQCQNVIGQAGNGINLDTCTLITANCSNVLGQSAEGILAKDSIIHVSDSVIKSNASDGISTDKGSIKLIRVSVEGVNSGFVSNKTTPIFIDSSIIKGDGANGFDHTGDTIGKTEVTLRQNTIQGSSVAISLKKSTGSFYGNTALGSSSLIQDSKIDGQTDTYDHDITIDGTIGNLINITVTGTVTLDNSSVIEWINSQSNDFTITNSTIDITTGTISGDCTVNSGSRVTLKDTAISGSLTAEAGSKILILGGSSSDADLTDTSLTEIGSDLGSTSISGGATALVGGSAPLSGSGSAISIGSDEPESGIDYVYINSDVVRMKNSSGSYLDGASATITLSSSDGSTIVVETDITETAVGSISMNATSDIDGVASGSISLTASSSFEVTGATADITAATITLTGFVDIV